MDDFNLDVSFEDIAYTADPNKNLADHNSTSVELDIKANDINKIKKSELNLDFRPEDVVQGIIYSEILGKPRALSPFRRKIR